MYICVFQWYWLLMTHSEIPGSKYHPCLWNSGMTCIFDFRRIVHVFFFVMFCSVRIILYNVLWSFPLDLPPQMPEQQPFVLDEKDFPSFPSHNQRYFGPTPPKPSSFQNSPWQLNYGQQQEMVRCYNCTIFSNDFCQSVDICCIFYLNI